MTKTDYPYVKTLDSKSVAGMDVRKNTSRSVGGVARSNSMMSAGAGSSKHRASHAADSHAGNRDTLARVGSRIREEEKEPLVRDKYEGGSPEETKKAP